MAKLPPSLAWAGRCEEGAVPAPLRLGDREVAALVGWGGLEVRDDGVDLLDLCTEYARAVSDFSCGQCIPCREGSRVLVGLLGAAQEGRGGPETLAQARIVAETMAETSRCDIGKTSPAAIASVLDRIAAAGPRAPGRAEARERERDGAARFEYRSILTAPCIQACPLHIDVPRYVEHIRNGRFREALATIEERLPFAGVVGRVCVKPCESHCRRGLLDAPVQIRHLKRFAADQGHDVAGRAGAAPRPATEPPPGPGAPVAVIGAGPSGLTCAKVLAAEGHRVTVFEKHPGPGGMLGVAIPSYRLPLGVLAEEVKAIEALGVRIVYGKGLGRDLTLADLRAQGFRAVFLAVGTQRASTVELEGDPRAEGVWDCLDFLSRAKLGGELAVGGKVVVLGGGNVAIDAARTARRLGATDVRIVYRRTRRQMRAHSWEIEEAVEEGIVIEERWAPKRIVSEGGRVRGIEVKRSLLGDARGGHPRSDDSECRLFEADAVVFAIGVSVDADFRSGIEGLQLLPDGRIQVDPLTFRTSVDGVFAGGDCVTGPNIVVQACAHGLLAGLQIARYLATGSVSPRAESLEERLLAELRVYDPEERVALPPGPGRVPVTQVPLPERTQDFREVESGFTAAEAVAEAGRCLRCYRVVTCAYRA